MLRTDRRLWWTGPAVLCLAAMWGLGCVDYTAPPAPPPVPPTDLGAAGEPEGGSNLDSEAGSSFGGTEFPDDNPFSDAPSLIDTPDAPTASDTPDSPDGLDAPDRPDASDRPDNSDRPDSPSDADSQ